MNTSKISVFITDDHPLIRQALKVSIQIEEDMEIVGTAVDGAEAIKMVPTLQPNIVIMDLMMPNVDGLTAIKSLCKICPDVPILALSSLEDEEAIFKAVQAGASGYLTKNVQHDELIDAIRIVTAKRHYLPDKIMKKMMAGMRQNLVDEKLDKSIDSLTKREKEILSLLGKGYSNIKISEVLVIAASTVRVHIHQIMKKMNFENRSETVLFAKHKELEK